MFHLLYVCIMQVRWQLETKMKRRFQVYDALLYRSQVVAGVNYIIKVSDILLHCEQHQLQLCSYTSAMYTALSCPMRAPPHSQPHNDWDMPLSKGQNCLSQFLHQLCPCRYTLSMKGRAMSTSKCLSLCHPLLIRLKDTKQTRHWLILLQYNVLADIIVLLFSVASQQQLAINVVLW